MNSVKVIPYKKSSLKVNFVKTLLLLFLFVLQQSVSKDYVDIGIPMTTVYIPNEHHGSNQNWWLAQTENGIIYNGTGIGLNEWDGEKWSFYNTPQNSRIRSVSPWHDGKIYVGTTNDFGYYDADQSGILKFTSLISDWTFEQHQFGEVWSTAANKKGVLFSAKSSMYFWDGKKVKIISDGFEGIHRVFPYGTDKFIYKQKNEKHFKLVHTTPELKIEQIDMQLPAGIKIRQVFINQDQNLVVFTDQLGIYERIDGKLVERVSKEEFPEGTNIYHAIQARDGYYYLPSLRDGLFVLSKELKLLRQYKEEHNIGMKVIFSVLEDRQGNIWMSGIPNIVKMIPAHIFSTYKTEGSSVSSERINLFQDKVTVAGDNALQLTKDENKLAPSYFKALIKGSHYVQRFIQYKGHLITAEEAGVFAHKIIDGKVSTTTHLIDTFMSKAVALDPLTNILFATTHNGLYQITLENSKFQFKLIEGTKDELEQMEIADDGTIWIGTSTQELYRIENAQYNDKETIIQKFTDKDGLGPNNVIPFKLSSGMAFGTNDGLMDFNKDRQPQLQFMNKFPKEIFNTKDMDVFRVYEDKYDRIWFRVSNRTGYIEKDDTGSWQIHEDIFRPIPDSGYKGFVLTNENIMWVSMANGQIFRLDIDQMEDLPIQTQLNIRKITNLDTEVEIYGGLNIPNLPLLDQQHNSIRVNYALTENIIPKAKKYRHRLLGSDYENWSNWSHENKKDFTLLRGNDYQFQVEAKDGWNRINSTELKFTVAPHWYLSQTAWIVYIILLALLLTVTGWITQKWRTKQLNLRNIQLESQVKERTADVQAKAEELKQQQVLKDRFFTNVSHEFRTPLTLIIAPLTSLINDHPDINESLLHPINTAIRNSKKMMSLVGQVLDINRLESGEFPLRVAQYDVSDLIKKSIKQLKPWAQQHNQSLSGINIHEPLLLYFDLDQIDKCLTNLIANAIKYSGENSKIDISVCKENKRTGIKVSDNGKGISDGFTDKIFQRYTQDKNSEKNTEPGTGIGLALVAELMVLHHGQVELINNPGSGCSFILWLQNGFEHFDSSVLAEPITVDEQSNEMSELLPSQSVKIKDNEQDITTLLIVDDNQELLEFIVSRFSGYYHILQASDGQQGLAIAQTKLPDLIISDVMMPKMDGYEMVKALKSLEVTSHIPIILLTAKSSKRETVEGLETGADDYVTKPFDTSELIVRVNGLINNRKMVREKIQFEVSQKVSGIKHTSKFIDQLRNEILKQLSDPKLNIESLANVLAISRSSLNRKCKNELNKPPIQYITEIRMQHALTLLKASKHSVSEIAYGVGFESLAYFSKSFKRYYGYTPSSV